MWLWTRIDLRVVLRVEGLGRKREPGREREWGAGVKDDQTLTGAQLRAFPVEQPALAWQAEHPTHPRTPRLPFITHPAPQPLGLRPGLPGPGLANVGHRSGTDTPPEHVPAPPPPAAPPCTHRQLVPASRALRQVKPTLSATANKSEQITSAGGKSVTDQSIPIAEDSSAAPRRGSALSSAAAVG
ncbi:hypothetical protein AAFF_G00429680 [Aldrovandia affinis]|uniref:Uncharacterized protein n=1 Tax=Aldrovandia affinis TaxID=143900 RepID=A0AAD7S8X7_9TELE|nr:hypothetical protein AAFF_G00429680 [Aldrovandia affinis]